MNIKKVKAAGNSIDFIEDFKRVREIMVFINSGVSYLTVKKNEVAKMAEKAKISYYITDKIFVVKRNVMIIY